MTYSRLDGRIKRAYANGNPAKAWWYLNQWVRYGSTFTLGGQTDESTL